MSILSVVKDIQQSVPIPRWKVRIGKVGTGVFVSSTVCDEWTKAAYRKKQTWCVFGTGEGYVYFELAKRLIDAGHSPQRVFTTGMLVGYDIDMNSIQVLKEKIFNLFDIDKSKITVYNKDYFELEETVNFDNFIINSPYLNPTNTAFVSHKHSAKAEEHWNRKGKGVSITKTSPLMSQTSGGPEIREEIFSSINGCCKLRILPDDAFNANVRTMYYVMNPNTDSEYVDVYGKNNTLEYSIKRDRPQYVFHKRVIQDIVTLVGTKENIRGYYEPRRVSKTTEVKKDVDTIILIEKNKSTMEKGNVVHETFGKPFVGMRFQLGGNISDEYRPHTINSVKGNANQTIRAEYVAIPCENNKDRDAVHYQLRHPLNAWIHAHTRTSEQSCRAPQFKFCCRISTDEFYNLWSDGNPTVQEYFDYWKIKTKHQTEILDWYNKYV